MSYNVATQWTASRGKLLLAVSLEPKEIGRRIAAARERRGWTQLNFAGEASVSPSSVARWEAGKLPPVRELMRIADVLGVDVEEFVEPEINGDEERFSALTAELQEVRRSLADLEEVKASVARIEAMLRGGGGSARAAAGKS